MLKVNDKELQFLEKKLARRGSIVFYILSKRVTQWDSTLHSELEVFLLESHCWAWTGFGTEPNYKAVGEL